MSRVPHALVICLLAAAAAFAHNIPTDFAVQVFVKPESHALRVLVRAPLISTDARAWATGFFEFEEAGRKLSAPRLAAERLSPSLEPSFSSWDRALAYVTAPPTEHDIGDDPGQPYATVLLEYPVKSPSSPFAIRTGMTRNGGHVVTAVRFLPASGGIRAYEFLDDSGLVSLDPHWYQAAARFVVMGFEHILDGVDHLLFLLCLVIPVRRIRALIPVVTAFTAAHSITLIASASGLAPNALWFPPLIEVLIAASILYMAVENIVKAGPIRHRWRTAFGFGLVHGFGFSFVLRNTLQFAGGHLLASLLSFNLGVEFGQLFALLLAIPVLNVVFARLTGERKGTIVLSFAVAATGAVWLIGRLIRLEEVGFAASRSRSGADPEAELLRWLIWIVALLGAWWIAAGIRQRRKST